MVYTLIMFPGFSCGRLVGKKKEKRGEGVSPEYDREIEIDR